jgi:WD40 repeat protein
MCRLSILLLLISVPAFADDKSVSFSRDVQPILTKSCIACHKLEKKKGKLDLTSFAALNEGGENGKILVAGKPKESPLVEQISPHGDEKPAMPNKGEPLPAAEVAIIARWVEQGAKDDTPASSTLRAGYAQPGPPPPAEPQVYKVLPVISALAASPDGKLLAVAGRSEVVLTAIDGNDVVARLGFGSPRITSLLFSNDGKTLCAAGGTPGVFGHVQAWDVESRRVLHNWRVSTDTLFGLAVSSVGERAAFGCADRSVRAIALADGKEVLNVQSHSDWIFGVAFSGDGKSLISAGRDRCVKIISLEGSGQPVDVNEPQEPATCLAKSPTEEIAVVGTANGQPRIYKVSDLAMRTEQKKDPNLLKQCERLNGPINAISFSRDGAFFAAAATGEVRIFKKDGSRAAILSGASGPVDAVAFSGDGSKVYAAGFEGKVRVYDVKSGKQLQEFVPAAFANGSPPK